MHTIFGQAIYYFLKSSKIHIKPGSFIKPARFGLLSKQKPPDGEPGVYFTGEKN
jgi:hypothetical protein